MAGPLYRSAREVMDDVPLIGDGDRLAARNVLAYMRSTCGQTYLRSTTRDAPAVLEQVAALIGEASITNRRNEAAQQWQAERAAATLEAARWVLEFAAANSHLPSAAWPPEAARKLTDALTAAGSSYTGPTRGVDHVL